MPQSLCKRPRQCRVFSPVRQAWLCWQKYYSVRPLADRFDSGFAPFAVVVPDYLPERRGTRQSSPNAYSTRYCPK